MFNKVGICLVFLVFTTFVRSEWSSVNMDNIPDDPKELDRLIEESNEKIRKNELEIKQMRKKIIDAGRNKISVNYDKDEMINYATTIASEAIENLSDVVAIASHIKKEFKKKYIAYKWHCFVGQELGFDFTKNDTNYIKFNVDVLEIVLFHL